MLQTSSQPSDTGAAPVGIRRDPDGWRQQVLEVFPLGARHYFDVFSIFPLLDLGGLPTFQPPESRDDSMQGFLERIAGLSVFYDVDPVTPLTSIDQKVSCEHVTNVEWLLLHRVTCIINTIMILQACLHMDK